MGICKCLHTPFYILAKSVHLYYSIASLVTKLHVNDSQILVYNLSLSLLKNKHFSDVFGSKLMLADVTCIRKCLYLKDPTKINEVFQGLLTIFSNGEDPQDKKLCTI